MSFGAHNIPDGSSVEEVAQQSTQETGNIIIGDVRPDKRVIRDVIDKPMDKENLKFIIGAIALYMICKK
jgi:hypothetical protein